MSSFSIQLKRLFVTSDHYVLVYGHGQEAKNARDISVCRRHLCSEFRLRVAARIRRAGGVRAAGKYERRDIGDWQAHAPASAGAASQEISKLRGRLRIS
jgi:hypothetical protein